jgi:hypothetical protein
MVLSSSHPRGRVPCSRWLALALAPTLAIALLAPAGLALSQPAPSADRADPLNAQAAVPPVRHHSTFATYRRLSDTPVGDWRQANDTVAKIGGWRAYAREAQAPASAPDSAAPK